MFGFLRSSEEKEIARRLDEARASGIKSMNVVGRGTLTMDPKELSNNLDIQKARREASKLVRA